MPLVGFPSLCEEHQKNIVSRDYGTKRKHTAVNPNGICYVTQYNIDGVVIRTGKRCDFLVINEDKKDAYLIELKGSDVEKAAEQLVETEKALSKELRSYTKHYRIVCTRCRTHAINSTKYKKLTAVKDFKRAENEMTENI